MTLRRIERQFERFRRRGDPQALAAVFDATAPEVLRVAAHLARDPASAEDLLQRTFLTAIEAAPSWDASRRLLPWLLGILANHARDAARKDARELDPDRLPRRVVEDPAIGAERRESMDAAVRVMDGLGDPARSILYLHFKHGLQPAEIALALGMAPATVRSHIHRGVETLRRTVPGALAMGLLPAAPALRGTAKVRSVVVARAADVGAGIAASAGTASLPLLLGGLLMGKKAFGLAAALALLVGGTAVLVSPRGQDDASMVGGAPPPASTVRTEVPGLAAHAPSAESPGPRHAPSSPTADSTKGALQVRVLARGGAPLLGEPFVLVRGGAPELLDFRSLRTGADGNCRIDGLEPGRWLVRTGRAGGAYAEVVAGVVTLAEVRLRRGVDVEGVVVNPAGSPVAGAQVWLDREQTRSYGMVAVGQADAEGRFRLEDLDPYSTISAKASGYGPSGARRLLLGEGKTETVRLVLGTAGGRVEGKVVDEQGSALSGALVLVGSPMGMPRDLPDGTQGTDPLPVMTYTDAEGDFVAEGLAVGKVFVTVRSPGHGALRTVKEVAAAPPTAQWTLVVGPRVAVAGIVVDEGGAPVPGARITTPPSQDVSWAWSTTSDDQGRFRLADLPAGLLPPLRVTHAAKGHADIGGAEADLASLRVVLRPWVRILARVVDDHGAPIQGRTIIAGTPQYPLGKTWAKTDAEGRASLDVGVEDRYWVHVTDPEGENAQPCARARDVAPGGEELTLVVREADRPTARLVGRVVGPEGRLPEGARAWVMPATGSAGLNLVLDPATGSIESKKLQPGRYEVSLEAPNLGTVPLGRVRLTANAVTDLGEVRLDRPGSLLVRVHEAPDLLRSGASVRVETPSGTVWARPGEDAVARFPCLQPGRYVAVVGCWAWGKPPTAAATSVVVVKSGEETTAEVTPGRGYLRRIRVEGLSPAEMDGLSLRVHAEGDETPLLGSRYGEPTRTGEPLTVDGAFAPGRYVAEATTADDRTARATFEVFREGEPPVVLNGFR